MKPTPLRHNPHEFAKQLGASFPIIQAPMAGGITTPALVAAVARADALGSIAGGMSNPQKMRALRKREPRGFELTLIGQIGSAPTISYSLTPPSPQRA